MDKPAPRYHQPYSRFALCCLIILLAFWSLVLQHRWLAGNPKAVKLPRLAHEAVLKCQNLNQIPQPPKDFHKRIVSDRFVSGTKPTLIRNATIWTGRVDGHEVIKGDLLLDKGIIKAVGRIPSSLVNSLLSDLVQIDANGSWITPGLVDLHSHLGVDSSPLLKGSADTNSRKGITQPWLRSLDGLNTHDEAYRLSISGGLTTAVILPGSANAIGGQAFVIKLRSTSERSPSAMLLEPPHNLLVNGTASSTEPPPLRWRQMKQACGENPSRVYSGTRMDTIWSFRQAYNIARQLKEKQDAYCASVLTGDWTAIEGEDLPDDLQWEMLVDVLRGRVKIHNHCYEPVDLDGIVRLTNEFKFSIAAFHHAQSAYLVPGLLKKAWGHPPAIAMFAAHGLYKREAYRMSEFAPRILADEGLEVVMKTDHPVLNSRYILYEAQLANYYGLKSNLALASVTTTPARIMGMDHRVGFIQPSYDADVVIWDSHPLALGATPMQVFIDGIPQLNTTIKKKPAAFQTAPTTPNFDKEMEETLKHDGLPPLNPGPGDPGKIVFHNVASLYLRDSDGKTIQQVMLSQVKDSNQTVVIDNGRVVCVGQCLQFHSKGLRHIDLEGGSIAPSLISYGSGLGLVNIDMEASANDGSVVDPLLETGSWKWPIPRAVDGLQFETRQALLAYRSGVSVGIVAPRSAGDNVFSGLSTAFSTSSPHKLAQGAIIQECTALHFTLSMSSKVSVGTQIAILRQVLLREIHSELEPLIKKVYEGELPVVISVHSADIMASLLILKYEVEQLTRSSIRVVFSGATEAHLIAKDIARAGVGVIVIPARPFPGQWETRRILPGPPLSISAISALREHNVTVAIGVKDSDQARYARFDLAWAALESDGSISKTDALALASVNLEHLFGIKQENKNADLVVTKGDSLFEFTAKVIGLISPDKGFVQFA